MRILSLVIVALGTTVIAVTWLRSDDSAEGPIQMVFPRREILITGSGNTLASVARRINDPKRIHYDPGTRKAVANATLVVQGELVLGRENDRSAAETLELDTEVCGDLSIRVLRGGILRMHHSLIRTVSQILTQGACTRGYSLFVDGDLTMLDSKIGYISGSRSECLRRDATARIERSTFSYCDGSALNLVGVDGGKILIRDSNLLGSGNWGLVIDGSGGEPIDVSDCVLQGKIGALLVTGAKSRVRLVDCVLSEGGIVFNGPSGVVETAWSRQIRVVDGAGSPIPEVTIEAESRGAAGPTRLIRTRTNDKGEGGIVLTEWVAVPGATAPSPGNMIGPWNLTVMRMDQHLVRAGVLVSGKDGTPIEFRLH